MVQDYIKITSTAIDRVFPKAFVWETLSPPVLGLLCREEGLGQLLGLIMTISLVTTSEEKSLSKLLKSQTRLR